MNNFAITNYSSKFQALVVSVDHNGTLEDKQKKGVLSDISPQTGRNLHLGVIRLGSEGKTMALNVLVPVSRLGEFRLPRIGDVIWVEESRRELGSPPIYLYSTYNSNVGPDKPFGHNPVPQWGSLPGDTGEIISYRDHIRQFVTTQDSNFKRKFIKSVTGTRFRQFYRGNLKKGRFAVRGDSVFDIDGTVNSDYLVEEGAYLVSGGDLELDQGEYPNPLNVPVEREEDDDFTYFNYLFKPIDRSLPSDHYKREGSFTFNSPEQEKQVLKNKNYMSYQPILDKKYLEYADFERELPAAEEYQIAIRGNNKLLIQDQYGDGEQLLITLKNQYDAGITIVHNGDKGQVRIRDHMGQGVLMEANPEAPRVILWTANRQAIELGGIKGVGEFTYIRNGAAFGDSQTSFGTKTGLTKDEVSNQEILLVSSPDVINELSSRLSSGMRSLATGKMAAGMYFRNNIDPEQSEQTMSLTKFGQDLNISLAQELVGLDGSTQSSLISQTLDGATVTHESVVHHTAPGSEHRYSEVITVSGGDASSLSSLLNVSSGDEILTSATTSTPSTVTQVKVAGDVYTEVEQSGSDGITVRRQNGGLTLPINIGVDGGSGNITVGNSSVATLRLEGANVNVIGSAVNVASSGTAKVEGSSVELEGTTVKVSKK